MAAGATPKLLSALQRTFNTQYALNHFVTNVSVTSAMSANVVYVLANGALNNISSKMHDPQTAEVITNVVTAGDGFLGCLPPYDCLDVQQS